MRRKPLKEEGTGALFRKDVSPEKILKLVNGMLVINMASLYDEIAAMKDEDFAKHVTENRNDFADWVRNAVGDKELADHLQCTFVKQEMLDLLNMRKENKIIPKLSAEDTKKLNEMKAFAELSTSPEVLEKKEALGLENKVSNGVQANGIEATISYSFKLDTGEEIKTIDELKDKIKQMDDATFKHYVGDDYNKFAEWVKKGLHNDALADKITQIHDKNKLLEALGSG